ASLAEMATVEPESLGPVAQLAVMPLLQAAGRRLARQVPAQWSRGTCPVCGAWPLLAELRGLERARRLRCGRCGTDWGLEPLRCPYCGVTDHRHLGSLVPEAGGQMRKVDTCADCKGYLKTFTTLSAWSAPRLAVEDLASVDLDLVALERGYRRPERAAIPLALRIESSPARGSLLRWPR
ncbi:MAG TPA: formate dehydrogenase accessory protein FdhE, partial [Chloroflexia bacterium]|nr:formate dehydrogenase accessory protein FdhE [Chloroflexia bacterium]